MGMTREMVVVSEEGLMRRSIAQTGGGVSLHSVFGLGGRRGGVGCERGRGTNLE